MYVKNYVCKKYLKKRLILKNDVRNCNTQCDGFSNNQVRNNFRNISQALRDV